MTNEELYRQAGYLARTLADNCTHRRERKECFPCTMEAFAQTIQASRIEAYEEAAKIADSYESGRNGDPADMIAGDIRALKDSLAQEVPQYRPEPPIGVLGKPPDSYKY